MTILLDLTPLADNFSGVERYAASLALAMLGHREHDYIVLFKEAIHPAFIAASQEEHVRCKVLKRCNKLLFNQIRLPREVAKIQADAYLFLAFPVPLLLQKRNMYSAMHDLCFIDCPETMTFLSRWYYRISNGSAVRRCRRIVTISKFSAERIRDYYHCRKPLLIYCGIDDAMRGEKEAQIPEREALRHKYNLPETYLLSLSTIEPRKNLRLLIEAYQDLRERKGLRTELVLAGRKGWKTEKLLDGIREDVREHIRFTGFVEDTDLPALYQNAELFVFPSIYEGFGMPPLEAMAAGALTVSSDAASLPEVLGDAAVYFQSDNREDLAKKIQKAIALTPEEKEGFRSRGYEQVKHFRWEREAAKLLKAIETINKADVCTQKRRGSR